MCHECAECIRTCGNLKQTRHSSLVYSLKKLPLCAQKAHLFPIIDTLIACAHRRVVAFQCKTKNECRQAELSILVMKSLDLI